MKGNVEKKERFLEYFAGLPVQKLAAGFAGVNENTIKNWKEDDQDFLDRLELAKSTWANKTIKGVKSKEWLLERVLKDEFSQRNELTGKDGKDLPTPIVQIQNVPGDNRIQKD